MSIIIETNNLKGDNMKTSILLFRPKPYNDESFTSYLTRIAYENNVSPNDLWRIIYKPNSHYPQSSFSFTLDFYPNNMITMNKLSDMLLTKEERLHTLTFANILRKFKIDEEKLSNSRMLSGLTNKHRNYCPLCLKEKSYYKLIWQVKEIDSCDKHQISLYSTCWKCNRKISLLPSNGIVGYCPHCNADLTNAPLISTEITHVKKRYINDWSYLIYSNNETTSLKDLSYEQTLALKLLYIMSLNTSNYIYNVQNIKQIARGTKSNQTYIHLNTILDVIRNSNISVEDFFKITPDTNFINAFLAPSYPVYTKYSCLSPWCSGYNKPGTLKRTTTSIRKKIDGSKHKYYMYCTKCGIEYCIDSNTNDFIERGYFINVGWNKVRYGLNSNMSIKEMSRLYRISEDKVKRCIIFLASNKLIANENLPLSIPQSHNNNIKQRIKLLISQGMPSKKIRKTLKLKYNEFLYYWFYSPIYIEHIKFIAPSPHHKSDSTKYIEEFNAAITHFIESDINITIRNISNYLNISPETLRYRGLLSNLKKAKQNQNNIRNQKNRLIYKSKAHNYIYKAKECGKVILSEDIYNHLGVRRTVLVRSYPDVTNYIYNLIREII